MRPAAERPFRLPGWVRYVALAIFLFWAVVYFYGGWNAPNIVVAPNSGPVLFILGLVIMALYFPLYYWRKRSDQRRPAPGRGAGAGNGAGSRSGARGRRIMMLERTEALRAPAPLAAGQRAGGAPAAGVLLASTGKPFSDAAISRGRAELAAAAAASG